MLRRTCALATAALASSMLATTDAEAAAQRTFVASHGNDANPCTLALPCRSFAAAIANTVEGGEVIVLDSAGYGPVTITQSVSITAPPGVFAGISVPKTGNATGVLIASAPARVVLRGLSIDGAGGTFAGGTYGIRMTEGVILRIENCVISNFRPFSGPLGTGVSIESRALVSITGSIIRDSDDGVTAGYGATVTIANSQILNMAIEGIYLNGGMPETFTNIFISDTIVSGPGQASLLYCIDNQASLGTTGMIEATRVTVTACNRGFENEPQGTGTMTVSRSMVTDNGFGFRNDSGAFQSLGDNHVTENFIDTFGVITIVGGH